MTMPRDVSTDVRNNSLATTQQPEPKQMTHIQEFMESEVIKSRFAGVLGERGSSSYITSVLLAVANNLPLQQCSPVSIYTSALRAATMRLSVDQSTGQAYLVPFKGTATLIVGWKGIYDMAIRTGKYKRIEVHKLYEGETFDQDRLTGSMTLGGAKKSNKTGGWLAIFEMWPPKGQMIGTSAAIYMTVEEIHAHAKKYSKGYERSDSAWKTSTEAMEKKTVLRMLLRTRGYLDPQDEAALNEIEEENTGRELPEGNDNFQQIEDRDDAIEAEAISQPPFEPVKEPGADRPYPPQVFKVKFENMVHIMEGKGAVSVGEKDGQVLAAAIDGIYGGDALKRHEFTNWLTGHSSTKEMTPAQIKALLKIMDVSGFDQPPSVTSIKEIRMAHSEALREMGQTEFPFEEAPQ
jgi:recombination protein RecT